MAGGTGLVYAANRNRVGILVGGETSAIVATSGNVLTFTNGTIMIVTQISSIIPITIVSHGELPTFGFTVTQLGTATGGTITEFFLPEEFLQAGLEEFRRVYNFPR